MAAVLLRRLFTNTFEDFWPGLGAEVHGVVKQELLLAVQNDAVDSVRRKICDALAELARNLFDENGNNLWPEVLKFLFELASSENPALRQSAFHVFGAVPGIFGNQQGLYIDVIKQMLSRLIFFASFRAAAKAFQTLNPLFLIQDQPSDPKFAL